MPKKSLENWLQEIESFHPEEIDLGLERISKVARHLNCLDFKCPVISVAGTNGKGSCVELIKQLAIHSHKQVGVYTSPHLFRFNERIVINDQPVSDTQLIEAFELVNQARLACLPVVTLSFFEFTTLAALWLFKTRQLDLIVLEVGLGGRLDAVNIVDSDIAVISSIGIDHEAWLGNDRESIAREKAGIARYKKPLIVGEQELPAGLEDTILEIGAHALYVNRDFFYCVEEGHLTLSLQLPSGKTEYKLSLEQANLSPANISTAIQAFACLHWPINHELLQQAIDCARLPGRFQVFSHQGGWVICDLTHNPAGAAFFAGQVESFVQKHNPSSLSALCGVMKDKDFQGMVEALAKPVDKWMLSDLPVPRAATAQQLKTVLVKECIEAVTCFASIEQAMSDYFSETSGRALLIVFGSFHSVGPAIEYMRAYDSSTV